MDDLLRCSENWVSMVWGEEGGFSNDDYRFGLIGIGV